VKKLVEAGWTVAAGKIQDIITKLEKALPSTGSSSGSSQVGRSGYLFVTAIRLRCQRCCFHKDVTRILNITPQAGLLSYYKDWRRFEANIAKARIFITRLREAIALLKSSLHRPRSDLERSALKAARYGAVSKDGVEMAK
jgi:hypothetical protein